jgi:hypothetical protein
VLAVSYEVLQAMNTYHAACYDRKEFRRDLIAVSFMSNYKVYKVHYSLMPLYT